MVGFSSPAGEATVEADFVVCALPFSILGDIEFSPPLSPERAAVVSATKFRSALRIYLQMAQPYWRDGGNNGFAVTDTLGEIWDPHFDAPRSPAVLVCYSQGDLAIRLGSLEEEARLNYAVQEL